MTSFEFQPINSADTGNLKFQPINSADIGERWSEETWKLSEVAVH